MKDKMGKIIKFGIGFGLLIVAYLPMWKWMIDRWMAKESYYGHGMLIPLVTIFLIWQKKDAIKKIKLNQNNFGILLIAASLLVNILCAALRVYFVAGFSFVIALAGLVLFVYGWKLTKEICFPLCFLFTMIPLPLVLIGNLTVTLKLMVAEAAAYLLNHIGFPTMRDGSILRMPDSYTIVAAPCSGLRSLISLLTLGLLFAYIMKMPFVRKIVLFLSSIPIAMITNIFRVMALAIANDLYGQKVLEGFFHDLTGMMVFVFAFLFLYGVSNALETKAVDNKQ